MKRFLPSFVAILLGAGFCAPRADAHPVPVSEFDRLIIVEIRPEIVIVDYQLEIDEHTLLALAADPEYGLSLKTSGKLTRQDIANALLRRLQNLVPGGLLIKWNGRPAVFQPLSGEATFGDSVKFSVRIMLRVVPSNLPVSYVAEDRNFPDKPGRMAIRFEIPEPLITDSREDLADYRRLGEPDEPVTAKAVISYPPEPAKSSEAAPPRRPRLPPTLEELLLRAYVRDSLAPLLDTDTGLWFVLAVAFFHGMLHILAPGQGRTFVAAYLTGERKTSRQAVILGIALTITHTLTAFAVAAVLRFAVPVPVSRLAQGLIGLSGGVLIAGIGVWLFVARLRGRPEHLHTGHVRGLALPGLSGGLVPCWGAILWILFCVASNRPTGALWTVAAFSLGLAVMLTALGLAVVRGRGQPLPSLLRRDIARWFPVIGAAVVVGLGVTICRGNIWVIIRR